jgi:serine/threonine-protein kinase
VSALTDTQLGRLRRELALPDLGDRYRLLSCLGRGGMGTVYLGHDTLLDREVAVKVVESDRGSAVFAQRLTEEARILAQLEHPGIVPIHDFGGSPEGLDYYVMKHVVGETFESYCKRGMPLADRLRVLQKVCETIAFAHAREVVHGDLSSRNVMVGAFGEVLTLDWGLARVACVPRSAADSTASQKGTGSAYRVGTPGYAAPELAGGSAEVTPAADIYAIGGLLRLACTGDQPDAADTDATTRELAPLLAICVRARADDVQDRYASCLDLAADLARYLDQERVAAYPEPWTESLLRLARKYQLVIALLGAYLVMRVLVAWWSAAR